MIEQSYERRRELTERLWDLARDTRYAMRSLSRSPGLAIVIVLTLSLGIGLNSTMFSLVNAYLFRPLPIPGAERLVVMGNTSPLLQQPHEIPYRDLQAYRELRDVFENVTGTVSSTESFDQGDRTERIWTERTLGNYFSTLRAPMALGSVYTNEASAGAERVMVVSYDFWSRRLGGDSSIIGRTVRISGHPRTVIGVTARGFHGFAPMIRSDAWSPIDESPAARRQLMATTDGDWYNTYGILRPGVSIAQARAAIRERSRQLEQQYPSTNKNVEPVIVPETRARPVITVASPIPLMAVVVLSLTLMVLVVACANVASLLLARGTTRHREHAVRAALGASRWRLTRQAILETAILSLAGALVRRAWPVGRPPRSRTFASRRTFPSTSTSRRIGVYSPSRSPRHWRRRFSQASLQRFAMRAPHLRLRSSRADDRRPIAPSSEFDRSSSSGRSPCRRLW